MSKHTPGPWIQSLAFIHGAAAVHVCTLNYMNHTEAQANARLIAAAPDLLAACQEALPLVRNRGNLSFMAAEAMLKHAIAKAEGTS